MFDQAAAQRAATRMIAAAPTIEGGTGTELAISVKDLVAAIMAAGNPDALVIPAYDADIAPYARYRLEQPSEDNPTPDTQMSVVARGPAVAVTVYRGDEQLATGLANADMVWHLGLALCSAAQESLRARDGVQA